MKGLARGLVLEVADDHLVVLTRDGAFLRVRRPVVAGELAVGAEVAFEPPPRPLARRLAAAGAWLAPAHRRRWVAAVAAAALLSALLPASGYFGREPRVYAHVAVDLPTGVSADLAVDAAGRVVAVRYLAPPSSRLPSELGDDLTGRDLASAIAALLSRSVGGGASEAGRPGGDGSGSASEEAARSLLPPVITVAPVGPGARGLPPGLAKKIAEADRAAEDWARGKGAAGGVVRLSLRATGSEVDSIREAASELGLSLGQYLLYLEAKKNGFEVDLSKAKQDGVARAIEGAGAPLADLLRKAQSERDFATIFRSEEGNRGHGEGEEPGQKKPGKPAKGKGGGRQSGSSSVGSEHVARPASSESAGGTIAVPLGRGARAGSSDSQPAEGRGRPSHGAAAGSWQEDERPAGVPGDGEAGGGHGDRRGPDAGGQGGSHGGRHAPGADASSDEGGRAGGSDRQGEGVWQQIESFLRFGR